MSGIVVGPTTGLAAGYILAGGKSSRMGRDKALVRIEGEPMLLRTARTMAPVVGAATVVGRPKRYADLGLRVIRPDASIRSPDYMRGVVAALADTRSPWNLIVPCDMPYLTTDFLAYIVSRAVRSEADLVARGLCLVLRKESLETLVTTLDRGAWTFGQATAGLECEYLTKRETRSFDSDGWLVDDMDTPKQLRRARKRLARRQGR